MRDRIIFAEEGAYAGWPANVGAWSWDNELLIGYTRGIYVNDGAIHNCRRPIQVQFSRSTDGGGTWITENPPVNWRGVPMTAPEIKFSHQDLAIRFLGSLDHFVCSGSDNGSFFVSYDRGRLWRGPFGLNWPNKPEQYCSTRTDYIQELGLIFMSKGYSRTWARDETWMFKYDGARFNPVSRVAGGKERAVMPATVYANGRLYSAVRRRSDAEPLCWIELFTTCDGFKAWESVARVTTTGHTTHNGNPPALAACGNRLVLAYGNRDNMTMCCRESEDWGQTWSDEIVFRDDFYSKLSGYGDLGYPRLLKTADDSLFCAYYWATEEHPHQHIAGTFLEVQ